MPELNSLDHHRQEEGFIYKDYDCYWTGWKSSNNSIVIKGQWIGHKDIIDDHISSPAGNVIKLYLEDSEQTLNKHKLEAFNDLIKMIDECT